MRSDWLENLDAGLPKPDLVIVLGVSQKISFARKKSKRDKFEKNKDFSEKISRTYRSLAKKKRWKLVDASGTPKEVHKSIMKIFSKKLGI